MPPACQYYFPEDLQSLESEAVHASYGHQTAALQIIADALKLRGVSYAVIGGMNFCVRGSGGNTQVIELALDGRGYVEKDLEGVLDFLNLESWYVLH